MPTIVDLSPQFQTSSSLPRRDGGRDRRGCELGKVCERKGGSLRQRNKCRMSFLHLHTDRTLQNRKGVHNTNRHPANLTLPKKKAPSPARRHCQHSFSPKLSTRKLAAASKAKLLRAEQIQMSAYLGPLAKMSAVDKGVPAPPPEDGGGSNGACAAGVRVIAEGCHRVVYRTALSLYSIIGIAGLLYRCCVVVVPSSHGRPDSKPPHMTGSTRKSHQSERQNGTRRIVGRHGGECLVSTTNEG